MTRSGGGALIHGEVPSRLDVARYARRSRFAAFTLRYLGTTANRFTRLCGLYHYFKRASQGSPWNKSHSRLPGWNLRGT